MAYTIDIDHEVLYFACPFDIDKEDTYDTFPRRDPITGDRRRALEATSNLPSDQAGFYHLPRMLRDQCGHNVQLGVMTNDDKLQTPGFKIVYTRNRVKLRTCARCWGSYSSYVKEALAS